MQLVRVPELARAQVELPVALRSGWAQAIRSDQDQRERQGQTPEHQRPYPADQSQQQGEQVEELERQQAALPLALPASVAELLQEEALEHQEQLHRRAWPPFVLYVRGDHEIKIKIVGEICRARQNLLFSNNGSNSNGRNNGGISYLFPTGQPTFEQLQEQVQEQLAAHCTLRSWRQALVQQQLVLVLGQAEQLELPQARAVKDRPFPKHWQHCLEGRVAARQSWQPE